MKSIHLKILSENHQTQSCYNQDKLELQIIPINMLVQYMQFLISGNDFFASSHVFLEEQLPSNY